MGEHQALGVGERMLSLEMEVQIAAVIDILPKTLIPQRHLGLTEVPPMYIQSVAPHAARFFRAGESISMEQALFPQMMYIPEGGIPLLASSYHSLADDINWISLCPNGRPQSRPPQHTSILLMECC